MSSLFDRLDPKKQEAAFIPDPELISSAPAVHAEAPVFVKAPLIGFIGAPQTPAVKLVPPVSTAPAAANVEVGSAAAQQQVKDWSPALATQKAAEHAAQFTDTLDTTEKLLILDSMAACSRKSPAYLQALRKNAPDVFEEMRRVDYDDEVRARAKANRKQQSEQAASVGKTEAERPVRASSPASGWIERPVAAAPLPAAHTGKVRSENLPEVLRDMIRKPAENGTAWFFQGNDRRPAFVETAGRLAYTGHDDLNAIRAGLLLAQEHGWSPATISGSGEFRKAAFREACRMGIATTGHKPSQEDLKWLREEGIAMPKPALVPAQSPSPSLP